jgi:uracil-DNA glycosylase
VSALGALEREIVECRRCPRLVAWREQVAREKRAAFRDWDYWGRPIAGFGDPDARVVLLGLAPAAHGANRTGYANQPTAVHRDDGLALTDCFITAAVRCAPPANKPLPAERDACADWLERELALLEHASVVVCLGAFAWAVAAPRPLPRFGHGAEAQAGRFKLLGCFHPSQQNTFTGKLTVPMMEGVLLRARELAS